MKKEQAIEDMYDLKQTLNKISDKNLKTLAIGFNSEGDGEPSLMCFGSEDESEAQKLFQNKSVSLLIKYFEKVIESGEIFEYDEDICEEYFDEIIGTQTKFHWCIKE